MSDPLPAPTPPPLLARAHAVLKDQARVFGAVEWDDPVDGVSTSVWDLTDLGGLDLVVVTWVSLAKETGQVDARDPLWLSHVYGALYLAALGVPAQEGPRDPGAQVLAWAAGVQVDQGTFAARLRARLACKNIGVRCSRAHLAAVVVRDSLSGGREEHVRPFDSAELDSIERALAG